MISNQIIQNTIEGVKNIGRVEIGVVDVEGKVVASTFSGVEMFVDAVLSFVDSPADSQDVQGVQFFKVFDDNQLEYVVLVKGESEDVYMLGKIIAFQIQGLLVAYKERYDKDHFIKNLLLDNLLSVDINTRSKKLHIDMKARRVVFIIEAKNVNSDSDRSDNNAIEVVRSLFATRNKDFITAIDENSIILVKEVQSTEEYSDLDRIARVIIDMLNTEALANAHVAYGTIGNDIKDVSRSYKEARRA